jgi:pSer/pThr/pTyr-binding forkhead associated (FHA) protein
MAVVLLVTTNDGQSTELLVLEKCTLGRSSNCDFKIDDRQMSGKHGVFELTHNGELLYTDLGSSNGSYLNNSKIEKIQFKINESLRLGNTTIKIISKKLTAKESISIGVGLSDSNATRTKNEPRDSNDSSKQESRVSKLKVKKISANGKDNIIDQEKSTGETKMLKLEIKKKPKR